MRDYGRAVIVLGIAILAYIGVAYVRRGSSMEEVGVGAGKCAVCGAPARWRRPLPPAPTSGHAYYDPSKPGDRERAQKEAEWDLKRSVDNYSDKMRTINDLYCDRHKVDGEEDGWISFFGVVAFMLVFLVGKLALDARERQKH